MNKLAIIAMSLLASINASAECVFNCKDQLPQPETTYGNDVPPDVAEALKTLARRGLMLCNEKNECIVNPNANMEWFIEMLKREGVLQEMRTSVRDTWCG